MATINQLSTISAVNQSDLLAAYSAADGDARKMSVGTLLTYFKTTFTDPVFITAVNSPVTGATITQPDDSTNQWAILTPAGTIATLTIVLPAVANLVDGQEILVTSSQIVTALTLNLNGATSADGVTAMTANGQFKLKYNLQTTSWYKVV